MLGCADGAEQRLAVAQRHRGHGRGQRRSAQAGEVGHGGQANHEYDLSWFYTGLAHGHMPSVSYLKAADYQDGHAGYSDPADEQNFLVKTVNAIMKSKFWPHTAIMITYDDALRMFAGHITSVDTTCRSVAAIEHRHVELHKTWMAKRPGRNGRGKLSATTTT